MESINTNNLRQQSSKGDIAGRHVIFMLSKRGSSNKAHFVN